MERTLLFDLDNSIYNHCCLGYFCSYLDQGIALWHFPFWRPGLAQSHYYFRRNSFTSFSKPRESAKLFLDEETALKKCWKCLLVIAVIMSNILGSAKCTQGWSGMVSTIEDRPDTILYKKYAVWRFDLPGISFGNWQSWLLSGKGQMEGIATFATEPPMDFMAAVPKRNFRKCWWCGRMHLNGLTTMKYCLD